MGNITEKKTDWWDGEVKNKLKKKNIPQENTINESWNNI